MHTKYIRKPRLSSSHGHSHVSNVPGLPNLSATTEEGNTSGHIRTSHNQHSHTGTLANPRHHSRFLVFICYPAPQLKGSHSGPHPIECHVLNPYPEPQLKDTFRATTHGTPASSPSSELPSECSSNSRSGESLSPERDAISPKKQTSPTRVTQPMHSRHPRILSWASHPCLSELVCRPKPKSPRLSELLEQREVSGMSLSLPSSDSSFVASKGHLDRVEASTTISSSGYRGFIVSSPIILEDFPLLTVYDWVDNGICEYYSKYKFSSSICKFVDINPVLDKDSPDDVVSLDKVGHLNNACHGPKRYDDKPKFALFWTRHRLHYDDWPRTMTTVKDSRILSRLDTFPRPLPARQMVAILNSTHPCVAMLGLMASHEGAGVSNVQVDTPAIMIVEDEVRSPQTSPPTKKEREKKRYQGVGTSRHTSLKRPRLEEDKAYSKLMGTKMRIFYESYFISITWPPPCAPMHFMEVTLPSLHMATTMHNKYIRKPRLSSSHGHNHVSNVPGLPNLSATTEEGNPSGHIRTSHNQHTHTGTLANPSYNSRFLVFICYPEPQLKGSHSGPQPIECHVLNPYPEPQLKDTFRATTHGTPASSPSSELPSECSSNSRSGESLSPERDAISPKKQTSPTRVTQPMHSRHPRILSWASHPCLSELVCRPKPKSPRLSELLEQREVSGMSLSLPSSDSSFVASKGHLDRVEASTTISSSGYRGFIVSSPIILEDFPLLTVYDWVDNGICEYYSKYKFSSSICKFVDINPVLDKDSPDDVVSLDKVGHLNNACHGPKRTMTTVKDSRILSRLDTFPRPLPARQMVAILNSTHPCVAMLGLMASHEGAGVSNVQVDTPAIMIVEDEVRSPQTSPPTKKEREKKRYQGVGTSRHTSLKRPRLEEDKAYSKLMGTKMRIFYGIIITISHNEVDILSSSSNSSLMKDFIEHQSQVSVIGKHIDILPIGEMAEDNPTTLSIEAHDEENVEENMEGDDVLN
ncbi:hypothetical protein DEO72_LG7g720 [Vigna unguiculata]|uniref:Uncharacterized protein n=1 Tax=Vigna unguiculata TaxID=3917 RepID=A0A4D6MDF2_VIGUN|nr:hypothetical protein DEO72_LG7g720 [Vigna unguiculata]